MLNVVVIGAGGHIGLPLSVRIANSNGIAKVSGFELHDDLINDLNNKKLHFHEAGLKSLFENSIVSKKLEFMKWNDEVVAQADVVLIIVGSPLDSEGNPRMEPLWEIGDKLKDISHAAIILRSTLPPGTTDIFASRIPWRDDVTIAFCPERIAQGKFFQEIDDMPQAIAVARGKTEPVENFFNLISKAPYFFCTPLEAELGKLFTNTARYIEFAVANEFQMIAESFNVDGANILKMFKEDYPRLNVAEPGPNVGGPCLFKDNKFLLKNMEGMSIIDQAFRVNEGMPAYIIKKMKEEKIDYKNSVLVLGAAFKANSDDIRNSLSFKLLKLLRNDGFNRVDLFDPNVVEYSKVPNYRDYDCIILMTPHSSFNYQKIIDKSEYGTVFIDLWKVMNKKRIIERK